MLSVWVGDKSPVVFVYVREGRVSNMYYERMGGLAVSSFVPPAPVTVSGRVTIAAASELLGRRKSKRPVCEFVQTPVSPTCQGGHGRWCTS